MSDYLDYLAARSLNLTSGIQPRLPGLFEPQQGIDEVGWMNALPEMDASDGGPVVHGQQISERSPSSADPGTELPSSEGLLRSSRQADSPLAKIQTYKGEEKESAVLSVSGPLNSISTPQASELPRRSALPAIQASGQIVQGSLGSQVTAAFDPVAAHNDPALLDRLDQRADAIPDALSSESLTRLPRPVESNLLAGTTPVTGPLDSISMPKASELLDGPAQRDDSFLIQSSSENLTQFFPQVESDLLVVSTSRQTKQEADGSSDTISPSKAPAALGRSRRRGNSLPTPSASENPAQPSHPKESNLMVVQTSRQGSANQSEIGQLHSIPSSEVPMAQPGDALLISAVDTSLISPAQLEEDLGEIHSPVSGSLAQERPDSKSSFSPQWMETQSILEAARARVRVPYAEARSKQPNAAQASSKSISARLDRIQHAILPATSTEKQDHPSLSPESQRETIERALPSSALTGGIPVRTTIQPAEPLQPGRSQMSLPRPVLHAEAPPEPVIHVNIGRIEVRAAPQTLAKRAPQSTLPTLSLDEYLKQLEDKR